MRGSTLPELWRLLKIEDVCVPVESVNFSQRERDSFRYIDISSIDRRQKIINYTETIQNVNAPSRAQQIIATNDVLVSTVRPGLNAVALVPEKLDNEICSSGFCVLRANLEMLEPEYLFAWVRSSLFIQELIRKERGIGYPSVSNSDVKNLRIPLPPLPEQRRIVAILQEADRLRQLRREAEEKAGKLVQALFYEMFGDPVTNPKKWTVTNLENVCNRITDGTHQPPSFTEVGIPFLFVSDIVDGEINLTTSRYISDQTYETLMKRMPVEKGDILYSIVGSYGVAVVVQTDQPFAFQRHIAHIKPNKEAVDPLFLCSMLNSVYVKSQADQRVRGIAQGTLNLGEISQFRIYVPPISLQQEFADNMKIIQDVKINQVLANQHLETLFQALLAQAFSGELTAAWREEHEGLEAAPTISHYFFEETLEISDTWTVKATPARSDATIRLSEEQQKLLETVSKMNGYFTQSIVETESRMQPHTVRQGLQLFTRIGLLQAVRLPDRPTRDRIVYVPAYRNLTETDSTREPDLKLLMDRLVAQGFDTPGGETLP